MLSLRIVPFPAMSSRAASSPGLSLALRHAAEALENLRRREQGLPPLAWEQLSAPAARAAQDAALAAVRSLQGRGWPAPAGLRDVTDALWPFSSGQTALWCIFVALFFGFVLGALAMLGGGQ